MRRRSDPWVLMLMFLVLAVLLPFLSGALVAILVGRA